MTPKLEIKSKEIGAVLICEPQGSPPSQYFVAHLRTLELDARTRVYAFQPKAPGVAEFFRSMAKKWRGWSGTLSYDSLDGEFGLAGIHDGLGHITLVVKYCGGLLRSSSLDSPSAIANRGRYARELGRRSRKVRGSTVNDGLTTG